MTLLGAVRERVQAHRAAVEVAEKLLGEALGGKLPAQREQYVLGMALYQLQEYEPAYEHLLTSFNLEPKAETAARIAVCAWRQGDYESATRWIRQAIEMEPAGRIETRIATTKPAYVAVLSQLLLAKGQLQAAAAAANTALKMDRSDVTALSVLASTQIASGDAQGATQSLERAIAAAPPFIANRLEKERETATRLVAANFDMRPFVTDLSAVARVIL